MQGRFHILCVDDDATGLTIRTMLLEQFGYEVFPAHTGPQAMSILASESVDLAILDYYLGSTTGTELAASLKKRQPELRIILLSGMTEKPEGLENVDRLMFKGEGPENLHALVRSLTGEDKQKAA